MTQVDIIELSLTANNIKFVRLDGKMSHDQRLESMQKFENDPSITVFLLSLKAGGVGLNLVAASRVYMVFFPSFSQLKCKKNTYGKNVARPALGKYT